MRQRFVALLFGVCAATVTPRSAAASCIDTNACLCGHNLVVKSMSPNTPWIVEVQQVLQTDFACPVAVGDEIELQQMIDPSSDLPNLGLAGSGDPVTPDAASDAGYSEVAVRPDLPPDKDLIANIRCGEIQDRYLIVDGDIATCNPGFEPPDLERGALRVEDAIAANASPECRYRVDRLRPQECNDVVVGEAAGCGVVTGAPHSPLLLLALLALVSRRRSQRNFDSRAETASF